TAAASVRIDRLPHLRLLRVVELTAFRDREEVETGASEFDAEPDRVPDPIALRDHLVAEKPNADRIIIADPPARRLVYFNRQTNPSPGGPAVTVVARIGHAQERGHRVSVRVVQFDAVKPGFSRPTGGGGEDAGQYFRQFRDMR